MMTTTRTDRRSDRGAVLVMVVVSMVVLLAFVAFVIDYGVMWTSRGQIQTSADAGALAGAIALAWDSPGDFTGATTKAQAVARANNVWGAMPVVDVSPACPSLPPGVTGTCVKVDAFRNQSRGNALPIYFGNLVGLTNQGVRATATAIAAVANESSHCLVPWMIPDNWEENTGPDNKVNGTDHYTPPDPTTGLGGTGYTVQGDIGRRVTLRSNNGSNISRLDYFIVDLGGGTGSRAYRRSIRRCSDVSVSIGDTLTVEPRTQVGPTERGVNQLVDRDRDASWNGTEVVGSDYTVSPRVVPVALFSPLQYASMGYPSGRFDLNVVNILGFFVERANGSEITGVIVSTVGELNPGGPAVGPAAAFLAKIFLVR
jgi:Flp pilus assembly protein TadG